MTKEHSCVLCAQCECTFIFWELFLIVTSVDVFILSKMYPHFSSRVSLSLVPVELVNFPRFCVSCRGILARISQEFLSDFCVSAKLTSPSCNSSCLVRPDAMRGGRGQARTACSCHHLLCHHHCHLLSTSLIANCSLVILLKITEVQHYLFVLKRIFWLKPWFPYCKEGVQQLTNIKRDFKWRRQF